MSSLDTTNIILSVMAVSSAVQLILFLAGAFWVIRQLSRLKSGIDRFESTHLPGLAQRADALMGDMHAIADRTERVGREIERTARIAQSILNVAGSEVDRATRGVRVALDLVEGGVRQASAVTAGLREGIREVLNGRHRREERRLDADAIARFEGKEG